MADAEDLLLVAVALVVIVGFVVLNRKILRFARGVDERECNPWDCTVERPCALCRHREEMRRARPARDSGRL